LPALATVRRGNVYLTTLPPANGSEQYGTRPVVVVSNDIFNQNAKWHSIIVVSVTTSTNQSTRATAVFLARGTANLKYDSYILCHQIFVIDKNKLISQIGTLPASNMHDVERALKVALYLP
jgi:mRNA interferase MazF